MTDDIVTRLRHMAWAADEGEPYATACADAADEIERLRFAGDALADAFDAETQPQSDREWRITQMWQEARRG